MSDTAYKALGRAAAVRGREGASVPFVFLTTGLPARRSDGDTALRAAGPAVVFDVVDLLSAEHRGRLPLYASSQGIGNPIAGFWTEDELVRSVGGEGD